MRVGLARQAGPSICVTQVAILPVAFLMWLLNSKNPPFFLTMAIAETYIRLELRQVRAAILGICALGHIYCALPRGDQSIIGLTATNPNLSRTDFLSLLVPVTAESLSALKLSLRIPCSR